VAPSDLIRYQHLTLFELNSINCPTDCHIQW